MESLLTRVASVGMGQKSDGGFRIEWEGIKQEEKPTKLLEGLSYKGQQKNRASCWRQMANKRRSAFWFFFNIQVTAHLTKLKKFHKIQPWQGCG